MTSSTQPAPKLTGRAKRLAIWRYNGYIGSVEFALGALRNPPPLLDFETWQQVRRVVEELRKLRDMLNQRTYRKDDNP